MSARRARCGPDEEDAPPAGAGVEGLSVHTVTLVLAGPAVVAPLLAASLLPRALTMLVLDEGALHEVRRGEEVSRQCPSLRSAVT